ncbi:GNAT family N-acetyltransferase [Oceanobacter mangrovi]|uniref:GNAT family N-acetyltransferase n=1 Tax=Oceanobacter mangrovi TaxID=2862510 RepID=UPI001C8DCB60|nr:GNAT family N-acetyltransferase [Oceanobacter mangrovi]
MKFTPTLEFEGGRVRTLEASDRDALFAVYQQPEVPGQRPLEKPEQLDRMIELGVQMAATQRGMMWALELGSAAEGYQLVGQVSAFDWQPSWLKVTFRIDALPVADMNVRALALQACIDFMADKYHLRNFAWQWIEGQNEAIKEMLAAAGFTFAARLRQAWRIGENEWRDVEQYHKVLSVADNAVTSVAGNNEGESVQ